MSHTTLSPPSLRLAMVDIGNALASAAKNTYCTLANPLATGLSIFGNIYDGLGGTEQGEDLQDSANLLRNASNKICNRPPEDASSAIQGGIPGGQCPGVSYLVTSQGFRNGMLVGSPLQAVGIGPIRKEEVVQPGTGTGPSGDSLIVTLLDANDLVLNNIQSSIENEPDIRVQDVVRQDGQPDDCGIVPGNLPAYDPNQWNSPVTVPYDDENNNPVSIDVDFSFGPAERTPGNGVSVPVTLDFDGDLQLFGDINLTTGDVTIGFGNSAGDGITDQPTELPDMQDPEELGLIVVGVRVLSVVDVDVSDATEIFQSGGNPNIFAPRLGHVAFQYATPGGNLGWGKDIPVKNTDQIIWSEAPAVQVKGTPNVGTSFTLRPIVVQACQETC